MPNVLIYTGKNCSYCVAAKNLLKSRGIEFDEIDITTLSPEQFQELQKKSQMKTIPQIFRADKLIGGFTELATLDDKDGLEFLKNCG